LELEAGDRSKDVELDIIDEDVLFGLLLLSFLIPLAYRLLLL